MATALRHRVRHVLRTKALVPVHRALYRWTGGRVGRQFGSRTLLLLTTVGRKSGRTRTTPLQYIMAGATYVVTASNWGQEALPAWYLNLQHQPRATIQVEGRTIPVTARPTTGAEKARLWLLQVARDATFDRYQRGLTREIPMVILSPTVD